MRLAKDTHAQDPHKPRQRSMSAGQWMDEQRSNVRAYEYLCHIGEAKEYFHLEYLTTQDAHTLWLHS